MSFTVSQQTVCQNMLFHVSRFHIKLHYAYMSEILAFFLA